MASETRKVALCALHGPGKPSFCVEYPKLDQYIPPECTYTFNGGERRGECACGVAACCSIPRLDGVPDGPALSAEVGGRPCKHIVWKEVEDEPVEKEASVASPPAMNLQDLVGGPRDS